MKTKLILFLLGAMGSAFAQTIPSADVQIKTALLASPDENKEKAMVYGYSPKGEFIVLRKGENDLVCLTDDPNQPGLSVACYHKSLDPFMARGRELKKEGKSYQERFDIRDQEVKAGKLVMPKQPTTLYVYSADKEKFNAATGEVQDGYLRYVIYIPYATAESTGLATKPMAAGQPWIMDPGTYRAHIMIDPPKK